MHMRLNALVLSAALALAACTTPADVSQPIGVGKGNDAKVKVADTTNGFTVDVRYSRYQFIPEQEPLRGRLARPSPKHRCFSPPRRPLGSAVEEPRPADPR